MEVYIQSRRNTWKYLYIIHPILQRTRLARFRDMRHEQGIRGHRDVKLIQRNGGLSETRPLAYQLPRSLHGPSDLSSTIHRRMAGLSAVHVQTKTATVGVKPLHSLRIKCDISFLKRLPKTRVPSPVIPGCVMNLDHPGAPIYDQPWSSRPSLKVWWFEKLVKNTKT